ncbi:MAG: polysaccharide deacetylase family protein [Deltaproteobacteria bacterium]|nr:polysaccharide deacetylase family protein [Deltaproteobacteria bacterium]
MRHALSIDLEDYYMSPPTVAPEDWPRYPDRLEHSVPRLLDWLAAGGHQATFFVLGVVCAAHPDLIRRIRDAGHEIGIHGWDHRSVKELGREEFEASLDKALDAVQSVTGEPVKGFRAAAFSLDQTNAWGYDVLLDRGFRYDASLAPFYGWLYGEPMANDRVHRRRAPSGRELLEIPLSVVGPRPFRLPVCGGFFLRLYPFAFSRFLFRRAEARGEVVVTYLHPWEAEAQHPPLPLSWAQRTIHFRGLEHSPQRIQGLLQEFQFASIGRLIDEGVLAPPADA